MLRLKDKELQRKLDELSDGDFSIALKNVKDEDLLHKEDDVACTVVFGKTVAKWSGICEYKQFRAIFKKDELEEIPNYDPKVWNQFPDVVPPEKVMMRVEIHRNDSFGQQTRRVGAWFCRGSWQEPDGILVDINDLDDVRFRPWED